MITSVRGVCLSRDTEHAVVEVGGIGLLLTCTPSALAGLQVGSEGRLATTLVIREDGWSLYGFGNDDERRLFDLLQTVAGVGPRVSLAAVGSLGAAELTRAIGGGDVRALVGVSGVGKRIAERIVLELREKVQALPLAGGQAAGMGTSSAGASGVVDPAAADGDAAWNRQVADGLVSLGWQPRDADEAVRLVALDLTVTETDESPESSAPDRPKPEDIGALLRLALAKLDRA